MVEEFAIFAVSFFIVVVTMVVMTFAIVRFQKTIFFFLDAYFDWVERTVERWKR